MSKMMTIRDHMDAIELLGGVVVVFVADDMPGATEEQRNEQLNEIADSLESHLIGTGSDMIGTWFGEEA